MKLRKELWPTTNIGDLVHELRYNSKNPINEGYSKYIGFEHIEPENLHLKQFGELSDGVTFKKIFRENDVLFGKIRAYLKKVAIAPMDGICSGDILVLRTKDAGKLSQELLPYFLITSSFLSRAVDSSVGTTLPRTKWSYLSKHEIPLPPLEEQKRIAALFQSIDAAIEQTEEQEKNLLQTKRQLLNELFSEKGEFGHYLTSDNYKSVSFGELAQNLSKRVEPAQTDLKVYVGLEHLDPDNLRIERQGVPDDVKGVKLLIWKGDIIFGKRRAYQRKVAVSHFDGICSAHSMVLRAKEKAVNKEFLPYFMQSDVFMNRAIQISEGSLSPTIKWKVLEKQDFSIPKIEFQEKLTDLFKQFDKLIYQLREQNQTLKKLKHQLLDEILG